MKPYYVDEWVTLYHGKLEDVLPDLRTEIALIMADPPYQQTALDWDRWPEGWPELLAQQGSGASMWCFGSLRMFMERASEFQSWRHSHDIVWEKQNGTGFTTDRFKGVHELASHWYRGPWAEVYARPPRAAGGTGNKSVPRRGKTPHTGAIGPVGYVDDGKRIARSVIYAPNMHGKALNETEKPVGILEPLISYGCPTGGTVLAPFAGAGSELLAARNLGRSSIGIEMRESQCEAAALRLSHQTLELGGES